MYEANLLSTSWTKRERESWRISKSSVVTNRFREAGFPNPEIPQYCGFHAKLEHISCLSEYLNIISAEATFNICTRYTNEVMYELLLPCITFDNVAGISTE